MTEKKVLRILQEDVDLKKLFNQEFLDKLNSNFKDLKISPVVIGFSVEKDDIENDNVTVGYRNDDDLSNNTVVISVSNNPDNIDKMSDSL
ncbi:MULTISPECIES: hypothetical protein [Methanobrevibacter]|jgi:hypothetical protein|uniref:hypothetical protein n=1 Tax=Methanobrevibacter TaxID=2172 RepID=UPI0003348A21|nr:MULTISPECIES: hypothetical protein [Methanobrevibacter]AGN16930.1 hypothetical protein Abm4_1044 [Methanobrevibacter sp. AbM4]MCI6775116.1 hypothetical protein [Methanobrevibacter boviskoreani]MDD6255955.1 hypothetical protein [Methanobrevibacter boviskoreani]MDY5614763.1 hypothetical protein [Methanobrevibacter boviskoreani]